MLADRPRAAIRRRRLSADGRVSVVGEGHYQEPLARAARGATLGYDWDALPEVTVLLVPEPDNRHDPHAVRVDIDLDGRSWCAGYLAREQAALYQPRLLNLGAAGLVGTCPGRLTGGGPNSYGLYLHLAGPDDLLLENLPDDCDVLPAERDVTVTKEEHHQDALVALHHGVGPARVLATLCSSTVSAGKYAGDYGIEVQVDGRRVGELTAAMSARYRAIITAAEAAGGRPHCEALITHGRRGYQIELRLPKPSPTASAA